MWFVSVATCGLSFVLNMFITLAGPYLDLLLPSLHPFLRLEVSRLYTVIFFIIQMFLWQSFWNAFTLVFLTNISLVITFSLTAVGFICAGRFNSLNGVPASVEVDSSVTDYCTAETLMQVIHKVVFALGLLAVLDGTACYAEKTNPSSPFI